MMRLLILIIIVVLTPVAYAQEDVAADTTLDRRLELAKKMHEIRPTKQQVDNAIEQLARSRPAEEREKFTKTLQDALNYRAIEKISIDAMAETYTLEELQAMVDYYSKPEALSAAGKEKEYRKKVYPEIVRMLDSALINQRTGGN